MIGFLRGIVHLFTSDNLLLEVNGVGYRLNFYHSEKLKIGQEILIYTYQNVREDEISLYGFLTLDEYNLFCRLISVKGIGPRIAAGILAKASFNDLYKAIENGDIDFIKRMPGVGKKTASQIILDLKGKLVTVDNNNNEFKNNPSLNETINALKALGYKQAEIDPIIKKLDLSQGDTQTYIRKALSLLAK